MKQLVLEKWEGMSKVRKAKTKLFPCCKQGHITVKLKEMCGGSNSNNSCMFNYPRRQLQSEQIVLQNITL